MPNVNKDTFTKLECETFRMDMTTQGLARALWSHSTSATYFDLVTPGYDDYEVRTRDRKVVFRLETDEDDPTGQRVDGISETWYDKDGDEYETGGMPFETPEDIVDWAWNTIEQLDKDWEE